ncbi:beta-galactosidase [Allopontixanthobacter confluentis]|nr:beta-galactosidase [Allopontixanthobacter confluentis]
MAHDQGKDAQMRLGVCYYPEHWPRDLWDDDARRMADAGITRVRIGEFAWSRLEPQPGQFDWQWLDDAIAVLARHGHGIILGTPTATPPKWLVDRMPDMLACDEGGAVRKFGSRRHYCFSHDGYRQECARITMAMAQRYGHNPAIAAWQTDNEYGCHDTVLSYSDAAREAFCIWLAARYGTVAALNAAWGNVFWSMEYASFDEVDLPNLTVTEANPAHWLAFRRFSSDQVLSFDRIQTDILRELSPGRDVVHNAMGFFTDYDHHALGQQLDALGWDSYPLGFLEMFPFSAADKLAYARQGQPDIAAFLHDLYRGCARNGRWWVLEQQPGPVNWARHNPAPLPGMVRLWTLEAMAHGAELTSYFRWRQAPFAQEQMHAGLLRPDSAPAPALAEVTQVSADIARLGPTGEGAARVAIVFAYLSEWVTQTQPQGEGASALWAAFNCYRAARKLGLNVDIIRPGAPLDAYGLVILPCQPIVEDNFARQLQGFTGQIIIGPRSGSKTDEFSIPDNLAPGPLQSVFSGVVTASESLRPGLVHQGQGWDIGLWLDHLDTQATAELVADDGTAACYRAENIRYLAAWPKPALIAEVMKRAARDAGLEVVRMPKGMRMRQSGNYRFVFNYSAAAQPLPDAISGELVIGDRLVAPGGVAVLAAG